MDPFTIRLLIGCLLIWLIAKTWAALEGLKRPRSTGALVWAIFVVLVVVWIFLAPLPFLNFHPR